VSKAEELDPAPNYTIPNPLRVPDFLNNYYLNLLFSNELFSVVQTQDNIAINFLDAKKTR
jgi:hypothetical protein